MNEFVPRSHVSAGTEKMRRGEANERARFCPVGGAFTVASTCLASSRTQMPGLPWLFNLHSATRGLQPGAVRCR